MVIKAKTLNYFSRLPQHHRVLWNDGPRLKAIDARLAAEGLAPKELGKGRNMEDIIADMVMVAEGVKSAPAVMALAEQYNVEMPIASDVYRVITGAQSASKKWVLAAATGLSGLSTQAVTCTEATRRPWRAAKAVPDRGAAMLPNGSM